MLVMSVQTLKVSEVMVVHMNPDYKGLNKCGHW